MEEQRRKNVEDIVNGLRQPTAPTNRKILKPNRHLTCLCSYGGKDYGSSMLKANSLLTVIDQCDAKEREAQLFKNCELKDSGTQTSKTIIQLAKIETGDMSPDSLSQSPRDSHCDFTLESFGETNFENFTLDGSRSDDSHIYERCHNSVIRYSRSVKTDSADQKDVSEDELREYPKSSLVEEFLRKTKDRNANSSSLYSCGDRAQFLQQKSPLNKLMKDVARPPPNKGPNLKSRSYVDRNPANFTLEESDKVHRPQQSRFMMKNQLPGPPVNCIDSPEPSSKYCPAIFCQNRRSNSFMQPTLASEQKSKLSEIKTVKHLISPIRRGRSSSPKQQVDLYQSKVDQIPYIDRSISEVSCRVPYIPKGRKSLMERQTFPEKLNTFLPPNNFQEDMRRIDLLSLSLPSDECLNGDRVGLDFLSVTSENGLSGALLRVQDSDWNVTLKGLAEITEFCRTMDPELMLPYMIMINQRLIELLKSPRSHVCRTACQAAGHLFESMKDTRGPEFNDIVDLLLCKTADANKFIRQDANLALDCMVTHIPTFHAVRAICAKAPQHKNHLVRSAAARLIICAVVIAGPDLILNPASNEFTRKRIFQNMIRFLEDKNLDTRKYGERLYKVLSKEPTFDQFLKKYMDKDDLLRMKKTLKFMLAKKH